MLKIATVIAGFENEDVLPFTIQALSTHIVWIIQRRYVMKME